MAAGPGELDPMNGRRHEGILGVDIGGSGIKAAVVDTATGRLLSERHRVPTPAPTSPDAFSRAVRKVINHLEYSGPVGCCFPTIVVDGEARSASNLGEHWIGVCVEDVFADATRLPFKVVNDADAAGVAEMRLGAGRDLDGTVITITIGTGIGSGMFHNGALVPNLELGHMPGFDGEPIERYASGNARKRDELSWPEWGQRFDYFLRKAARVCTPDHFILSGGASKKFDKFRKEVTVSTPCHVAEFLNDAGIVGAALVAAESR